MKRFFYFLFLGIWSIFTCYLLVVNVKLHHSPTFAQSAGKTYRQDVYYQHQHLKKRTQQGAGKEMQTLYPEGFFFMNVLYGLSWADLIANLPETAPIFKEGQQQIAQAISELASPEGQRIFPADVQPTLGAFYNGWLAYLLGKKLALAGRQESIDIQQFKDICERLALAYQKHTYLRSYQNGVWQADNVVCIASLALHDRLYTPQYQSLIKKWLQNISNTLDKEGLLPHSAIDETGKIQENARGSSLSLMLCFLPEIDAKLAQKQYALFQQNFLAYRFGLLGVCEYPTYDGGGWGLGDIDSGPVLLGIGGVGSIVSIRACLQNGDVVASQKLRNSVEAFGFAMTWNKQKYYLGGFLEVVDAFTAWVNVVQQSPDKSYTDVGLWFFHFLSLALFAIGWWLLWWKRRKKEIINNMSAKT